MIGVTMGDQNMRDAVPVFFGNETFKVEYREILPWIDGDLKFKGKMGRELTTEDGYQAFRLSGLNAIALLKSAVGELSRIKRILRLEGTAHCTADFTEQPQALNGASHLFNEVFGEKGRHSRMVYSDPAMCLDCATLLVVWAEFENGLQD